jgi:hypothetical protein
MTLTLDIRKAIIVTGRGPGPDHVGLETNYPSPTPGLTAEPLSLTFNVADGDGERYVREVLAIPPELVEVITCHTEPYRFGKSHEGDSA